MGNIVILFNKTIFYGGLYSNRFFFFFLRNKMRQTGKYDTECRYINSFTAIDGYCRPKCIFTPAAANELILCN